MNIPNFFMDFFDVPDIAVVSATPLPETIVNFPVWLYVGHAREELRSILPHPGYSPSNDGYFNRAENLTDRNIFMRQKQQMSVFRHNHKGPQVKRAPLPCGVKSFEKPIAGTRTRKELLATKTREGQIMCVAAHVKPFAPLSINFVVCLHDYLISIFDGCHFTGCHALTRSGWACLYPSNVTCSRPLGESMAP